MHRPDVLIIGGGIAGLTAALHLTQAGCAVTVLEKHAYPRHKVCGEYVSKETLPYLRSLGFDPYAHGAADISKLRISTPSGKNLRPPLGMGAFALSRYAMDEALANLAREKGATVLCGTTVTDVQFEEDSFTVTTRHQGVFHAPFVIGAWGKRDGLDKKLERPFMKVRTRYVGVKYHIRLDNYPHDEIGLDNFEGGYCGIVKIEGDRFNLCNFYRRPVAAEAHRSVGEYQERIVLRNPVIRDLFAHAEFLFDEPVVINEVSFDRKAPVERHIFCCGDTAGLITPLCGNGMSMAMAGAKIVCESLIGSGLLYKTTVEPERRAALEQSYTRSWNAAFRTRLFFGRSLQRVFGNTRVTELALRSLHFFPSLERRVIDATHGKLLTAARIG